MSFAHMVLYRILFGVLALSPLIVTHRPHLNAREWGLLGVTALLGVPLQFLVQFHGLSLDNAVSHASLMVGTLPVLLAVGAMMFAHEANGWRWDGYRWGHRHAARR